MKNTRIQYNLQLKELLEYYSIIIIRFELTLAKKSKIILTLFPFATTWVNAVVLISSRAISAALFVVVLQKKKKNSNQQTSDGKILERD